MKLNACFHFVFFGLELALGNMKQHFHLIRKCNSFHLSNKALLCITYFGVGELADFLKYDWRCDVCVIGDQILRTKNSTDIFFPGIDLEAYIPLQGANRNF